MLSLGNQKQAEKEVQMKKQCGRARSHILAGVNPAPEGWPATG